MKLRRTNKIKVILFFIICVLGSCIYSQALQAAEHPWQLRIDKSGVKAYTRKIDGSPILEFKGHVIVNAPLSKVLSIFEDIPKTPRWFYQCIDAELVENENSLQKVVYIVLHLPWPVSERDCVFRINKFVDTVSGTVNYTVVALPDRLPRRNGRIRVPYLKASWRFAALPDGMTEVDFQQHSDPGGFIPKFLSNSLVVDMPYHSLKNLRGLIMPTKKRN